jgi:phospho-N-acetylmuramoyl-pentapeptide-transferase
VIAILVAGAIAGGLALIGTPLVIAYFRTRGFGQPIREEGPQAHQSKAGTPTMGGTAIVLAAVVAYLVAHVGDTEFTATGALVLLTFVGMAVVGFADDFIKVRHRRNLGLNKTTKFTGQAIIAAIFAFAGPALAGVDQNI